MARNSYKSALKSAYDKAGIGSRDFYAFRHSFATRWIANGGDPVTLAKLTGTSVEMIAKTYGHVDREWVKIISSNLKDILSPFGRTLSLSQQKLTPREIQIANLIREGRTTKEIATLLNASERTITTHRDNIRKKLGLNTRKANLQTHLKAIS